MSEETPGGRPGGLAGSSAEFQELRIFLKMLNSLPGQLPDPERVPVLLSRLAVTTAQGDRAVADELVQDVTVALLVSTRRAKAGSVTDLLAEDDASLIVALRRRLRQVAVERRENWGIWRRLLRMVGKLLEEDRPRASAWPTYLTEGDRLSPQLVMEAIECGIRDGTARDAGTLTRTLMARYFPDVEPIDEGSLETAGDDVDHETRVRRAISFGKLDLVIREYLGPDLFELLELRFFKFTSLAQIAALKGQPISTVHAQLKQAQGKLKVLCKYEDLSAQSLRAYIEHKYLKPL